MATTGIGKSKYYKQEKKKIKKNQQQNVGGDVLTPGSRTPTQERKEKERITGSNASYKRTSKLPDQESINKARDIKKEYLETDEGKKLAKKERNIKAKQMSKHLEGNVNKQERLEKKSKRKLKRSEKQAKKSMVDYGDGTAPSQGTKKSDVRQLARSKKLKAQAEVASIKAKDAAPGSKDDLKGKSISNTKFQTGDADRVHASETEANNARIAEIQQAAEAAESTFSNKSYNVLSKKWK